MTLSPAPKRTAFVVLGMHRSGTSAVAGTLAKMGASPPSMLMPAKADNPLGFWESERVVAFNDEILKAAGSSWQDWGPLSPDVFLGKFSSHFNSASRWILHVEFGEAETIVLKDPRICRFYPFWRDTLCRSGFDPVVILPVRAPEKVAISLQRRNGLRPRLAMRLWLRHVLDAEFASRGGPRKVATLDDLIAHRLDRFTEIVKLAGGSIEKEEPAIASISEFWDRSSPSDSLDVKIFVPDLVQRTWEAFEKLSEQGDNSDSHNVLDEIRRDFNELCLLFYDPPEIQ